MFKKVKCWNTRGMDSRKLNLVMSTLKVVVPWIQRKNIVSFRRVKPTETAEGKKKVYNSILINCLSRRLRSWKRKKIANANLNSLSKNIEKVYINDILSPFSSDLIYHTRRFQKANGWKFSWSSDGVVLMRKKEISLF